MRRIAFLLCCACASAGARAEDIDQLDIGHEASRYRVELRARLDAPLADSYAVFRDFRNLPRINDAVEAVDALPAPAGGPARWHTRVRVCFGFFCSHLDQVQDVRESREGAAYRLDAVVIPALSNLRYGVAAWKLEGCGPQTCLWFRAELEPDFWVPPLLGPWLIERTMRRQAHATAHGIEVLALAHQAAGASP